MNYFPLTQSFCDLSSRGWAHGANSWDESPELSDFGNIGKGDPSKILYPAGSIHTEHVEMS